MCIGWNVLQCRDSHVHRLVYSIKHRLECLGVQAAVLIFHMATCIVCTLHKLEGHIIYPLYFFMHIEAGVNVSYALGMAPFIP